MAAGEKNRERERLARFQGVLVAGNMRVGEFVAELARYRPGLLRCDPAVADLRVTGVFSLRDTDRALTNLTLSLPLAWRWSTRCRTGASTRSSPIRRTRREDSRATIKTGK
jgi:ferric-dicitrate binding protein FerR (iron transport regulator)